MSHIIIDRRKNDKGKSTVNRSRYIRRYKEAIKESVRDHVRDGSISDSLSEGDKVVKVKRNPLDQPWFHHKPTGGIRDRIIPGNKKWVVGDKFRRQEEEDSQGGKKAGEGEGQDDFEFVLTYEEYLDVFFENLYLPDMVKKDLSKTTETVFKRAGFTTDGNPSRLNIIRSMKQSMSRTIALCSDDEEELAKLEKIALDPSFNLLHIDEMNKILLRIEELKKNLRAIPFIDDIDLRYNRWEKQEVPNTQAVIFGLMDVSGSMGEWEKDMAKRFFLLMLIFLKRKYDTVVFVPLTHTSVAKEVTEEEFFKSRDSGGTKVSSVYELMRDIQKERFPLNAWNVYGVQISDGDNESSDIPDCVKLLKNTILPMSQYLAYIETKKRNGSPKTMAQLFATAAGMGELHSELYLTYKRELSDQENFEVAIIGDASDIYPVFRKLFEKKPTK